MGLNDQAKNMTTGGGRKNLIWKDGTRFRNMTGKDPIAFRILPAFDPNNPDPATSCVTYISADGQLSDFGMILYIGRFIGHGGGKFGTRQDLLSLRTFAKPGEEIYDPLEHMLLTIQQNSADWGYLMEDQGEGKSRERAAFSKPLNHFAANIWDANQGAKGVQIGVLSSSACNSLIGTKSGLVYQRNNLPAEITQTNHLLSYAVGDLTSPAEGPVLICQKRQDQGEFSKYEIILALDDSQQVVKRPIGTELLAQRYNMTTPADFINIPTEQDIVDTLVVLLNGRSPAGYHEHALIKMAFPSLIVPDAPTAPAATPTIAVAGAPVGGFGAAPVAAAPVAAPVAAGTAAPAPVGTAPVAAAAPVAVAPAPVAVAGEASGAAANMAAAAVAPVAVAPAVAAVPVAAVPVAAAPVAAAPVAAAPVAAVPVAAAPVAAAPVAGVAPVAGAAPAAPGDPVPEFNQGAFLDKLRDMNATPPPA